MKNNMLHTPDGVKDYLPNEFAVKTEIERRIEMVFCRYGYSPVSSPMFENIEVFEGTGSVSPAKMYKFLDRDGTILSLRPDMTPAIARIATTVYNDSDMPLRFCYFENMFRYGESYQGKLKEFTQAGIELIGAEGAGGTADAEVIAVAVNSLIASGIIDFHLEIGCVKFLEGLLDESGLNEESRAKVMTALIEREFTAIERIAKDNKMPKGVTELFSRLPFLSGDIKIIETVKELTKNAIALSALDEIAETYEILRSYGVEKHIMIDLSMSGQLDYYTGLIFRGFARNSGSPVLEGGRYDALLSRFGCSRSAVGFAIKINRLLDAASNGCVETEVHPKTLVAWAEQGRNSALKTADELRRTGVCVENSLAGADVLINLKYAENKKFGGMLYFKDEENVTIYDLTSGEETNVKINDLLSGGRN